MVGRRWGWVWTMYLPTYNDKNICHTCIGMACHLHIKTTLVVYHFSQVNKAKATFYIFWGFFFCRNYHFRVWTFILILIYRTWGASNYRVHEQWIHWRFRSLSVWVIIIFSMFSVLHFFPRLGMFGHVILV